jgi:thiosulfate/3-mercaptopyruvate sulfurtransferase
MTDPVIAPEALPSEVVLVDARSGADARARFEAGHLRGARHVDLDHDLAAHPDDPAIGGRHPLPAPASFAAVLGRLGITPASDVVVYDDKGGANAASRFWWMLRAAGHTSVRVLDGGLAAALAAGVPTETGPAGDAGAPPYPFTAWGAPTVTADEVGPAAHDPARLVVDVRDPTRYRGDGDPFDPSPGHVPGAVNVPFASNLGPDGRFLSAPELAAKYRAVLAGRDPSRVILQCGSGVTACHTLLALERAGLRGAALYVGSWSEWSRSGRPVARGDDPG